ncbi:hypothetical protein MABM_17430 [Mycobacteroides abscessus]|uniref:Bacteriophage protein n=1 Tax=Mycobacteroides abscessus subsp. bolletii 50594 TaxID=1303024 RepID=A0AB33A8N1_9MYCO|nr:hypothetical protein [Mycobacteroides abscessus]AGM28153.1 hypothetical protein MASS_1551 [Mycobacteroides abscessus subsp. bolletii 50594]BBZ81827.1 hypothetical protein MABM_17430 [Mycobacteroides abscessus]
MSDEPSDAQKLIAEVHQAHWPRRRHDDVDLWTECRCGAGKFYNPADHSKHFAAELDKALGGLTRERSVVAVYPDNEGEPKCRFVSGWTVTE